MHCRGSWCQRGRLSRPLATAPAFPGAWPVVFAGPDRDRQRLVFFRLRIPVPGLLARRECLAADSGSLAICTGQFSPWYCIGSLVAATRTGLHGLGRELDSPAVFERNAVATDVGTGTITMARCLIAVHLRYPLPVSRRWWLSVRWWRLLVRSCRKPSISGCSVWGSYCLPCDYYALRVQHGVASLQMA